MGENAKLVNECYLENCPFWSYRFGKKQVPENGKKILTPIKSIRAFCLECSTFNNAEVRNCGVKDCPIYSFRMGRNPNRAGIGGKDLK